MRMGVDIRILGGAADPKAVAEAVELFARSRELELRLSRVLGVIEAKLAYRHVGSSSIGEFARRNGFDGWRATELARLGRALPRRSELGPKLQSGELTIPAAAAVAPILAKPEMQKPGEDWVKKAEEMPLRDLRQEVKIRVEEFRQGVANMSILQLVVGKETRRQFRRARDIASPIAKKDLSDSQTFARITRHYVHTLDPLLKTRRARRMGPTAERPFDRGVAAETVLTLQARSDLKCEIPGCVRVATEKAHVRPHELGSGREARDLWNACHTHHTFYDERRMRISGWTPDGKPIFVFADGSLVRARPATSRGVPGGPRGATPGRARVGLPEDATGPPR